MELRYPSHFWIKPIITEANNSLVTKAHVFFSFVRIKKHIVTFLLFCSNWKHSTKKNKDFTPIRSKFTIDLAISHHLLRISCLWCSKRSSSHNHPCPKKMCIDETKEVFVPLATTSFFYPTENKNKNILKKEIFFKKKSCKLEWFTILFFFLLPS